jgi:DNA-binding transcriptional LysR family regulator
VDRLKAIETFVEIVGSGSFSAAARKLRTSRAMVSRHVQQLEEYLGAQLFNRTTRQLSLTEIGEEYFNACKKILGELTEADTAASQLQAEPRGTLKITAPTSFGNLCLAPILAEFLVSYPDISASLVLRSTSLSDIEIADAGVDVAIVLTARLADSSFIARKIGDDRWIACASPAYLARNGAPQDPTDLAAHNCLLTWGEQNDDVWRFTRGGEGYSVRVSGSLTSNIIAARAAALAGVGIALLPTYCIGQDLAEGRLVQVCPSYDTDRRSIYALYSPSRYTPRKVRIFVDFLAERLRMQGWSPISQARSAAR